MVEKKKSAAKVKVVAKVRKAPRVVKEEPVKRPAEPVAAPPEVAKIVREKFYGTGRRKTSVARVWLLPGTGRITVNDREVNLYAGGRAVLIAMAQAPLRLTKTVDRYDVEAKIFGGGIASQFGALKMGLSRALSEANPDFRPLLRQEGMLSRDPRMKERKKYGHKRARKSFQYSKR